MNALNLTNVELSEYADRFMPVFTFKLILQLSLRPIGIITSLINITIFSRKAVLAKSSLFYYLLAMSWIDLLYMVPILYLNLAFNLCSFSSTQCGAQIQYSTFVLLMAIIECISSALAFSNTLIELFLAIQRVFVITNKPFMRNWPPRYVISTILIATHIFYMPLVFRQTIVSQEVYLANSVKITEYKYVRSQFGSSQIGRILPTIWSIIRLSLCGPILLIANLVSIYYFRVFLNKKKSTTGNTTAPSSKSSAENNLTTMLIMTSFLYTFGNLPYMVWYSVTNSAPTLSNSFTFFLDWFSVMCLIMLVNVKPVIYFAFNKFYKALFLHFVFCKPVKAGLYDATSRIAK